MSAFRANWITEIGAIHSEMERLMGHYAGSKPPAVQFTKGTWEPAVDVYETPEDVVIVVDLAGVDEDRIQVMGDRSTFIIRGERAKPGAGEKRTYSQMEILSGPFERVVPLPAAVDVEQAQARYASGMLEITIPKSQQKPPTEMRIRIVRGRRIANGS